MAQLENIQGVFLTWKDLVRRFTEQTLRRAFDDDDDGSVNAEAIQNAINDAESDVLAHAGKHHAAHCNGPASTAHPQLKKMALDAFTILIYDRAPKLLPMTATTTEERRKTLQLLLSNLALNKTVLHGATPVATNVGGEVFTNDPDDPAPKPHMFLNGFGDF